MPEIFVWAFTEVAIPLSVTFAGAFLGVVLALRVAAAANRRVRRSEFIEEAEVLVEVVSANLNEIMGARFSSVRITRSITVIQAERAIANSSLVSRRGSVRPETAKALMSLLEALDIQEPVSLPRIKSALEKSAWLGKKLEEERRTRHP